MCSYLANAASRPPLRSDNVHDRSAVVLEGPCLVDPREPVQVGRATVLFLVIYLLLFRNGPGQLVQRDVPLIAAWLRSRRAKNGRPVIPLPD